MLLTSLQKAIQYWLQQLQSSPPSTEYQQWRQRFTLERIHFAIWVAIILLLIYALIHWTIIFPWLDASDPDYKFDRQERWLFAGTLTTQQLGLLFGLVLLKTPLARRYPVVIFLWLSSILLLTGQIIEAFRGKVILSSRTWMSIFTGQALLVPVRWQWHLLSQVIVLSHFAISYLGFGLTDSWVKYDVTYFRIGFATAIVCFVADLGVFMYERSLQREFELRRQLRLFLHAVSHDLRNPVLGTTLLLKTFRRPFQEQARVSQEMLEQIISSAQRQLELIDSLLEAYGTENQGMLLRTRPIRLKELIESVITQMKPFLEQAQATVTQSVPSNLPLVNIDPLQVRRVYENLIANALEYNQPGLRLTLQAELIAPSKFSNWSDDISSSWVRCTVSDNGKGMSQQQCTSLFELYTRASSAKHSLNLGLGLYICRQIITAHGGEIGVISSPEAGATFWFTLPVAKMPELESRIH